MAEGKDPNETPAARPAPPAEADRLIALGAILPAIAHELGNALTGVLGTARLLASSLTGERERERLDRLSREAERARRLLDDVSALARGGSSRAPSQPLGCAQREALRLCAGEMLASGIDLVEDPASSAAGAVPVAGSASDLTLLVLSLARAAALPLASGRRPARIVVGSRVDAGATGPSLVISAQEGGLARAAGDGASAPAPRVTGLPETTLEGFVAARLAERCGARLESSLAADGERTLFATFAAATAPAPAPSIAQEVPTALPPRVDPSPLTPPQRVSRPGRRVLVVDDDPILASLIVDSLTSRGFEVDAVHDGDAGLRRALSGDYDLVIADLNMPGRDGEQMCDAIRARRPSLLPRVIVASGDASLGARRARLDALGVSVVEKPFRAKTLAAAAEDVLRRAAEQAPVASQT